MSAKTDQNINAPIAKGFWGTVEYAVCKNGSRPAEDFIRGLNNADKPKVAHLFMVIAATGVIRNPQKFKKLEGKIFEFKSHQIRIACFQVRHTWFLTNGFFKDQDDWPSGEVERAIRIMAEHMERANQGEKHGFH
jgi:hypothetical protein